MNPAAATFFFNPQQQQQLPFQAVGFGTFMPQQPQSPAFGSPSRKTTHDPYAVSVTPQDSASGQQQQQQPVAIGGMQQGTPSNLSFDIGGGSQTTPPPASPLIAPSQQQQQPQGLLFAGAAATDEQMLLQAFLAQQQQQQQFAAAFAGLQQQQYATNVQEAAFIQQQMAIAAAVQQQQQQQQQQYAYPQDPAATAAALLFLQQQLAVQQQQQQQQPMMFDPAMHLQQQQGMYLFNPAAQQQHQPAQSIAIAVGQQQHHQQRPNRQQLLDEQDEANMAAARSQAAVPTFEALLGVQGQLCDMARTANGSSMIQNAIKERSATDPRIMQLVCEELYQQLGDLLLDSHGCYVVKTIIDHLAPQPLQQLLQTIAADEQLAFSLCTHSLHTRRVVQHVMEHFDAHFLIDLLVVRCAEVAMTQQGCIVMQRAMDRATGPQRDALYATIHKNFLLFCRDAFANYVVQHLLEVGNRESNSAIVAASLEGRVVELSCNKFASNVVEKCLFHVTAEVQHQILVEMYSAGEDVLHHMLQDSFGNYIIQSSIALATFRDVWFINQQLRPVLRHTPYGHKIEARLDRRMKGKAVQARQHMAGTEPAVVPQGGVASNGSTLPIVAAAPSNSAGSGRGGKRGGGMQAGGRHPYASAEAPMVPANEEPW